MRTHDERVLVAGLGSLNADLSRYILTVIVADHEGTEDWPHTVEDELALALRLMELAGQVQIHAQALQGDGTENETEPTVVMGNCGPPVQIDSSTES